MIRGHKLKSVSLKLLALVVLTGAVAWFCEGMLFEGKIPFFRDLVTYSYPMNFSVSKSVLAGELPLWDRHMAGGFPLLAAFQSGVFYPPTLLFYLLPFFEAIRWTFFVHFLIAAYGAYCLCRNWNHPIYVCILGALLFAFGGTIVSLSNLLNHFQSAVWLPWVILCGERYFAENSWTRFVLLVFILLCSLLGGSPEIYAFSIGLLLIDGIRVSFGTTTNNVARTWLLIGAANIVVLGLGMVQVLPTIELLMQSRRNQPIPFLEAVHWSLKPANLIGLLIPDKEPDNSLPLGVRLFVAQHVPFLLSYYFGVLSILGISLWVYVASWKERLLLITLLSTSLALALGNSTPLYRIVYEHIWWLSSIRFPEKYFFITSAFLFYVVIKGLGAVRELKSENKVPVVVLSTLFFGWVSVYGLCRMHPDILSQAIIALSGDPVVSASTAKTIASITFNLERQIGVTVALLLAFLCGLKFFPSAKLRPALLVLILLVDLSTAHKPLLFLAGGDIVTDSDRILPTERAGDGRLFYYPTGSNLHPSSLTVLGRPSYRKAVALPLKNLLPNAGIFYGFDYFQEIDALTRRPYNDFLNFVNLIPPEKRINLFRVLNIRYVISFKPLDIPGMRLSVHFPEHFSWLYEVDDAVARVYIASRAVQETHGARTLRILSSGGFDPRTHVLVKDKVSSAANHGDGGEARIVHYSNNRVIIDASLAGSGILVLTDSFYPGWKVFVDGREKQILQANHFFRGVELPGGNHRVEFVYDPLSFKIGLIISSVTAVLLIVLPLIIGTIRRTRHRALRSVLAQSSLSS